MSKYLNGCQAITSCLGHNITWKGMYLKPRRLVTDAARRITILIRANKPEEPIKYIIMNTTGNSNRDLNEPISIAITSTGGQ